MRILLYAQLALASKLWIPPFTRIEDGLAIYSHRHHGSSRVNVDLWQGKINLSLQGNVLSVDGTPEAIVVLFNEGQLAGGVFEERMHVMEGSQVVILAHKSANARLDRIRNRLKSKLVVSKEEFLKMARAQATRDWALIEATIEWMPTVTAVELTKERFCGGHIDHQFEIFHLTAGLLLTALLFYAACVFVNYIFFLKHPFEICGSFRSNGSVVCTSVNAHFENDAINEAISCFDRHGVLYSSARYGFSYNMDPNFCRESD